MCKINLFMLCNGKSTCNLCCYCRELTSDWLERGLSVSVLLRLFVRVCLCVYFSFLHFLYFVYRRTSVVIQMPHMWNSTHLLVVTYGS